MNSKTVTIYKTLIIKSFTNCNCFETNCLVKCEIRNSQIPLSRKTRPPDGCLVQILLWCIEYLDIYNFVIVVGRQVLNIK